MLIYLIATVVAIVAIFYFYLKLTRHRRYLRNYSGPKGNFFVGNALEFQSTADTLSKLLRHHKKYGSVFKYFIANMGTLVIADYKILEFLLTSNILEKSVFYVHLHKWLGTGLLTASENKWRKHRKMITPTFHFKILEQFIDVYNTQSNILVKKLEGEVGKEAFNICPYISLCTLDVICETAMGTSVNAQEDAESEYVKAVHNMCRIVIERGFSVIESFDFLYKFTSNYRCEEKSLKILHGYTNAVLQKKKKEFLAKKVEQNGNEVVGEDVGMKKKMVFIDLLLEYQRDGNLITDDEIRQEVDTFMFEGHDTTASGISFAIYNLAIHQEIQNKILKEQIEIFGNNNRNVTFKDLQEMKYLDMVIKESLRIYPSVPFYGRALLEDFNYKGTLWPKGMAFLINAYAMHRDPEYFPNPEKFDPERFSPENYDGKNPFSFIPFSAGPRNCIGQKYAMLEMKSILSKLVRNYEILPTEPVQRVQVMAESILKSQNGIMVHLKKRN